MDTLLNQKPCVVETPQGFSVSYKNHFLYSKYNPSKTILQTISSLNLLPGTIILCNSPVLEYGIKELQNILPSDSLILFCEADSELKEFTLQNNKEIDVSNYYSGQSLNDLPLTIYKLVEQNLYKRVIRIDFSAGTQFYSTLYDEVFQACTNSISTFWKNRITLTKFGRKYSYNLFWNLKRLTNSTPISSFTGKISKPILVCGAGQSLDFLLADTSINIRDFFILAVDTALQPLQKHNIIPDGVFIEEAQAVISKAFIGAHKNVHYFAGLSSIPFLYHTVPAEKLSFFATEYTNADFFERLKQLACFPAINKPFGSVGLTAVYYALKFRKNDSIPVYFTGLDFSYSAGFTHAKNTLAHNTRLISNNRIISIENYGAAFNATTTKLQDKNRNIFYTTPTLSSYAQLFNHLFAYTPNLYDCGISGIPLAVVRAKPTVTDYGKNEITQEQFSNKQKQEIKDFLELEKKSLVYLRDLLTGKVEKTGETLEKEISELIRSREYLYLHFADGFKYKYTQSFLNRVRTEIDFFLKALE